MKNKLNLSLLAILVVGLQHLPVVKKITVVL